MRENKKFWISTVIAIIALLISLLSVGFNEYRYFKSEQESVFVDFKKFFGEYPITTTEHSGINGNGSINTIWEVLISNTGKSVVSITEYNLWVVSQEGLIQYSGLNQGLYNDNQKRIYPPINIAPGNSIKLFLKIGISIGPKASKLIQFAPPESKSEIMTLSKYLAGKGEIDIFDNPVTPMWSTNKKEVFGFSVNSTVNDQKVLLSFKTANNNHFHDDTKWYDFPKK